MNNKIILNDKAIFGIILLIGGVIAVLYVQPSLDEWGSHSESWREWHDVQETYETYIFVRIIGVICVILGIIAIVIGLIESPKYPYQKSTQQPQYPQQQYHYPRTPTTKPPSIKDSQIKICKSCYAQLDVNWTSCPYCGYKQSAQQPQVIFCNNCKKQVTSDFSFCPHCSQPLISGSGEVTNRTNNQIQ